MTIVEQIKIVQILVENATNQHKCDVHSATMHIPGIGTNEFIEN